MTTQAKQSDTMITSMQTWRSYPYRLVPDDPQLHFPQAEGYQDMASDTYYASGVVRGERTGKGYAFFVIFARLSGFSSVLGIDMHLGAIFDLASGGYTTFASYDLPPRRWVRKRLTLTRGALASPGIRRTGRAVSGRAMTLLAHPSPSATHSTCTGATVVAIHWRSI
jgi:hypothetical protein